MKYSMFFTMCICVLVNFGYCVASLDGTINAVYKVNHHVFHDQDFVKGFVAFNKGFTVVPVSSSSHGANLFMDTSVRLSGAIDLRGTNTITLLNNLYLDKGVTFSDSGRIYSYGSSLVMHGDLTIPADKVLHCGGSLIINGNGNTLHLGSNAQLFLDDMATVTLRNMKIKTKHSYPGAPAIALSSHTSKLAFDNVKILLGDDFYVNRGQLFFHNDVMITGSSSLVYRSTMPSYITAHAKLKFDYGTTFSYAPATDNKDLIVMSDASSTLVFNGCSLKSTHTGLRLVNGHLYFDDKVVLNSQAGVVLNSTMPVIEAGSVSTGGTAPISCSWSPDGKYVAVVNGTSHALQVYAILDGKPMQVGGNAITGSYTLSCAWSPDGKYLAVVNRTENTLQIFAFFGETLIQVGSDALTSESPRSVAWSSDGKYVAVVNQSSHTLQIFSFLGRTPVQIGIDVSTGVNSLPVSCSWSPDGKFVAVANGGDSLRIFAFWGSTPTQVGVDVSTGVNSRPVFCSWSPDGRYLAVVTYTSSTLQIFAFSGGTPTLVGGNATTGPGAMCCSWSPDGRYIAVTNQASHTFQIFGFYGQAPFKIGSDILTGDDPAGCSWSADGKYVAVVNEASGTLQVFSVNYQLDTTEQPISRGIIFGNSLAGPLCDLDIHVLADAALEIQGNVFYDQV